MNFIHYLTAESKVAIGLIIAEKLFHTIEFNELDIKQVERLLRIVGNGLQGKM
ncbi:hypothetical protein [Priestia endophytica]|uniref:hypothetical protein n=1 Tax=Priestia endophytica TaxID=135735 RepID=UPI001F5B5FCC|nr:hypothetical protein [Priestia endophytica]